MNTPKTAPSLSNQMAAEASPPSAFVPAVQRLPAAGPAS